MMREGAFLGLLVAACGGQSALDVGGSAAAANPALDASTGSGPDGSTSPSPSMDAGVDAAPILPECDPGPGAQPGSPWPMYGRCPSHEGRTGVVGAEAASVLWQLKLPLVAPYMSTPVIDADGTIYVVVAQAQLMAVSPAGSLKWASPASPAVTSVFGGGAATTPAIGRDGTTFWTYSDPPQTGSNTINSHLVAVSHDGTVQWDAPLQGGAGSPTMAPDGSVLVATTSVTEFAPSGSVKWSVVLSDSEGYVPAVGSDGTIYVAGVVRDGNNLPSELIYALTPDGTSLWQTALQGGDQNGGHMPVLAGGAVYVTTPNALNAVGLDGTPLWTSTAGTGEGPALGNPAVDATGRLFFSGGAPYDDFALVAVTPTGAAAWTSPTGTQQRDGPEPPVTIGGDGALYFNGVVYRPDGSVKATSLGGDSSVIGSDGTVYTLTTGLNASTLTAYGR